MGILDKLAGSARETVKLSIHPDLEGLIWIADGPSKNWTPVTQTIKLPSGDKLTIKGIDEPSVIRGSLPVVMDPNPRTVATPGYYPSYQNLTPEQRGMYLNFLSDPYDPSADISYVFILYYGLERQLLVGDTDRAFEVILKLRDVHSNASFQNYSSNALLLTSMIMHRGDLLYSFVQSLDKSYEYQFSPNLYYLNMYAVDGGSVDPLDIMMTSKAFGFRKQTYIRDYPDVFVKVLAEVAKEKYGDTNIVIRDLVTDSEYQRLRVVDIPMFANMSLNGVYFRVKNILEAKNLKAYMLELLETTHEITKKLLAEARKQERNKGKQTSGRPARREEPEFEIETVIGGSGNDLDISYDEPESQPARSNASGSQQDTGSNKEGETYTDKREKELGGQLGTISLVSDYMNYSLQQNGFRIIPAVKVVNNTDEDYSALRLRVSTTSELFETLELPLPDLKSGDSTILEDINIPLNAVYLANLNEGYTCRFAVELMQNEDTLTSEILETKILAYDEWQGLLFHPRMLGSFVMPNHPVIAQLMHRASEFLGKWTDNPSLEGYQSGDPNRVRTMAAAAYAAIQEKNIIYAEPPKSFDFGQRVRLPDMIMDQHMGTCLDMTLLYAALLESMGLNPILVLIKGHIFAGVWLVESSFQDEIMDDPTQIEKRMSRGISELTVVECTAMCAGKTRTFEDAEKVARINVGNYGSFLFAQDVARSRAMGVRPMPVRIKGGEGYEILHEERKEEDITSAPEQEIEEFVLDDTARAAQITKLGKWERKLLDLSLRNMLINMRVTKSVMPLLSGSLADLEDALSDGEEFQMFGKPRELQYPDGYVIGMENTNETGPYADLIKMECRHHRLHTIFTDGEANSIVTKMYRSARTSMEENGASTLYMTLGLLRWFENKTSEVPRYAPLILIPVELIRKSASKGYVVKMRDEEAQFNITLLEMLKQEFDISIGGLEPLPTDAHGIDIKKIFAIVRKAIVNETMWDIIESAFIGNFSFSQFVMWKDIHGQAEFMYSNKIVRSLMENHLDEYIKVPEKLSEDTLYIPIATDASQTRAIQMAVSDTSFVLQGPPGTGKSQTITAMIANAMANRRKVLFVAEKMAALSVVEKRLHALGLEDFCLQLHSNKANKKDVLDYFRNVLEISAKGSPVEYERKAAEVAEMKAGLDRYADQLHMKRSCGMSLFQLISGYIKQDPEVKPIRFSYDAVKDITRADFSEMSHNVSRLIRIGRQIGSPHNHPLRCVVERTYAQSMRDELPSLEQNLRAALEAKRDAGSKYAEIVGVAAPVTAEDWTKLTETAKLVVGAESIPDYLKDKKAQQILNDALKHIGSREKLDKRKQELLSKWNDSFLRLDMTVYENALRQASQKLFGQAKAVQAVVDEVNGYAKSVLTADRIPAMLADVKLYQQDERALEEKLVELDPDSRRFIDLVKEKKDIYDWADKVNAYRKQKADLGGSSVNVSSESAGLAKAYLAIVERADKAEEAFNSVLKMNIDGKTKVIDEWMLQLDNVMNNQSDLRSWILYSQVAGECRDKSLGAVVDAYENGFDESSLEAAYRKGIYQTLIRGIITDDPSLDEFTGSSFSDLIERYKKADKELMELTKKQIYYLVASNLPRESESAAVGRELNLLRRAIATNGRGMSIRGLFDQIPTILMRLCPCMMMSPVSVAQYMEVRNNLFDIVVFDEASQIPTCKAVGVLARARNAIIVGDPNQMPPTSFFAGNTVDEDNLEMEDLESILDDCIAIGIPQTRLGWHYRSRHESLIAFSNREFYSNKMLTFPSVNDRETRVSLVKVDGTFDRGKSRQNKAEAAEIVKEILRRYFDPATRKQSIGVVTFNIPQQLLIEDMLQEEYRKNSAFDAWANESEETLFVKNLENVQGDERDVIMFSVGYGPDKEGKVSMNFGPINREGGWKRLNVAVSRSRIEMIVFASMDASQIDLTRTKARGVKALRDFLEFAEFGRLSSSDAGVSGENAEPGIIAKICSALEEKGYRCVKQIGHSDFRVDIGVVDPYDPERYLLGIMLDGDNYRIADNARDREIGQIGVLGGLGWNIHRVWTMDWWDNSERELNTIFRKLDELSIQAKIDAENKPEKSKEPEREIEIAYDIEADEPEKQASVEVEDAAFAPVAEEKPEAENVTASAEEEPGTMAEFAPEEEAYSEPDEESASVDETSGTDYVMGTFASLRLDDTSMSVQEFCSKESQSILNEKIQQLIESEAPITQGDLTKKLVRSCGIGRLTPATEEWTEKLLKKLRIKSNKLNGVKSYWRDDQDPADYRVFRAPETDADRRELYDIVMQEKKNAVCLALIENGPMDKDSLIKEVSRMMGWMRLSDYIRTELFEAIKYAKKVGAITLDEDKLYCINK